MKKIGILIISLVVVQSFAGFSQTPDFEWLINGGFPATGGSVENIAIDRWGNSYISGNVGPQALLGTDVVSGKFLAKLNTNGDYLWTQEVSQKKKLCTDTIGNLITLTTTSGGTLSVTKLDSAGNTLWTDTIVGADIGVGVNTDSQNNVCVTVSSAGCQITFDDGNESVWNSTGCNNGEEEYFVAKYDPNGSFLWAINSGADYLGGGNAPPITAKSMSIDGNDNVIVSGKLEGSFEFGQVDTLSNSFSHLSL